MLILGLNAYHGDSSACILRDGKLIAAAEEERFRRIKHWAGLPTEAIRYCLCEASASFQDVDHVAINRKPGANNFRRLAFLLKHRPAARLVWNRLRNISKAATIESALQKNFAGQKIRTQFHRVEHHRAHLASAFLVSPFEEAVAVSVDGFGDFASAAWGMASRNEIQIDGRIYFPHSLGIFYSAITQFLGFPNFGDEYKVMGLAPCGKGMLLHPMRQIVRVQPDGTYELDLRFFRHHTADLNYSWDDCEPRFDRLYTSELETLLGPARNSDEPLNQRHMDIARSAQMIYEEAFFALLNSLHEKYRCPNLALAGGCAMNSVANGKVYERTPFKKMYLPAAAGDAGGAIGAAFAVHHQLRSSRPQEAHSSLFSSRDVMTHAYVGPQFTDGDIEKLLGGNFSKLSEEFCSAKRLSDGELCKKTAAAISEGKVIGWFQGRMEFGPRALGNRSILCDPRRADMKNILNDKIKRRESFRPFAPAILRESVCDWFETDDDVPFMTQVFQVRPEKRALIPAVTHIDGSGRLQTVHRETNPLFHRLIEEFQKLTYVPLVLNTSFNENEPIVCKPEEALDCFLRTKMDALVIGNYFIERKISAETKTIPAGKVSGSLAQT